MTIRLTEMLNENMENRVNLMKVEILMEKVKEQIKGKKLESLSKKCMMVKETSEMLNNMPYTIHGLEKWNFLKVAMITALTEIKTELVKLKDVDVTHLVKALDEIIVS